MNKMNKRKEREEQRTEKGEQSFRSCDLEVRRKRRWRRNAKDEECK